jgi:hypothetical protein
MPLRHSTFVILFMHITSFLFKLTILYLQLSSFGLMNDIPSKSF